MNVTRHLSDTRTAQGRVRFLTGGGRVRLLAEGPGWQHDSLHATMEDAVTFLAVVPRLTQALYEQALDDLERHPELDGAA